MIVEETVGQGGLEAAARAGAGAIVLAADDPPIMENQMEKKMENEMETGTPIYQ